ncbi:MAG: PAS domain-containing sensor histidine kinase [Lachnospiraceae bacterium]|nr:PAS domain-containing sensor histidine kinase [Lachnospiraceae bacterium]
MTKRIFQSICIAVLCTFAASVLLFMGVLYNYFSGIQRKQLRMQADLAAQGVANEGSRYFEGLSVADYRITWIDMDGVVLYDSQSDSAGMENHLKREEIRQAFETGVGESARDSVTLLRRSLYFARRLPDGTVIRLSVAQNTMLTLFFGMIQPICAIFLTVMILALILADRLSRGIVRPLNSLNLNDPLSNKGYDELKPLLGRIAAQQRELRKQREELQQKQSELKAVTTGMAEGIVLLNEKKIILSINPAARRLFETDDSCVGKYLVAVNDSLKLQELLQKAGDGQRAEMRMELGAGMYQMDASPVFSEGMVFGVVLRMLDVTEKEKVEQMRREFTANVSHELKTPLHTILGSAELMANGMVKQEDMPAFARRIHAQSQRMIRLVEDILRLSRLDEGAGDMQWEEVDLYELAKETVQSLLPEAETFNVRLYVCGEPAVVYGIRQLLAGILFNLCDNAVKYNRPDGSVRVIVKAGEGRVLLSVADTGIGIPPECRERIFERFYRVDKSHSQKTGGTGLGLSIVKHAAKLHDAAIEIDSVVDGGTTITVCFPLYRNFTKP